MCRVFTVISDLPQTHSAFLKVHTSVSAGALQGARSNSWASFGASPCCMLHGAQSLPTPPATLARMHARTLKCSAGLVPGASAGSRRASTLPNWMTLHAAKAPE